MTDSSPTGRETAASDRPAASGSRGTAAGTDRRGGERDTDDGGTRDRDREPDPAQDRERFVTVDESGDSAAVSVDREAVREQATDLLREWEAAGLLEQVRERTRTVTAVALVVFVVSYVLRGSGTGITGTVASLWLAASGVVGLTVGAVALLLRGIRQPSDVADAEGVLSLVGLLVLAVGGRHYTRTPALRAAWRYLITGPLPVGDAFGSRSNYTDVRSRSAGDHGSPAGSAADRPAEGSDGEFPIERYVRWAGGLSAAAVLLHQAWLAVLTGESLLAPAFDPAGGLGGVGPTLGGAGLTAGEQVVVLAGVVVVGALLGALLAVSQ